MATKAAPKKKKTNDRLKAYWALYKRATAMGIKFVGRPTEATIEARIAEVANGQGKLPLNGGSSARKAAPKKKPATVPRKKAAPKKKPAAKPPAKAETTVTKTTRTRQGNTTTTVRSVFHDDVAWNALTMMRR